MANLTETSTYDAAVYQIETTDPVLGGPGGIANTQAQALANRTKYLKDLADALGSGKQPLDATLTALAALVGAADKMPYFDGADSAALASLTAFARTLLDDADAATARGTLGAAPLASPTFTGTPAAPTATAGTNTTQLATTAFVKAAADALLASPALSGNPTAPTPSQFDDDTSIATTAFVRHEIGNVRTYTGIYGNNTLTAADSGAWFEVTAAANLTLPNAATKAGMVFNFNNTSSSGCSLYSNGGNFYGVGSSGTSTFTVLPGVNVKVISDGSNWKVVSGVGVFSLAASGYQKLPSGLIFQWSYMSGLNYNSDYTWIFPIAFPNASLWGGVGGYQAGVNGSGAIGSSLGSSASAKSGFTYRTATTGVLLIAIGY